MFITNSYAEAEQLLESDENLEVRAIVDGKFVVCSKETTLSEVMHKTKGGQ